MIIALSVLAGMRIAWTLIVCGYAIYKGRNSGHSGYIGMGLIGLLPELLFLAGLQWLGGKIFKI